MASRRWWRSWYSVAAAALEFLRGERTARVFWGPLPPLEWVLRWP